MSGGIKARMVPLYFETGRDAEFENQCAALIKLLDQDADILAPQPLGTDLPECDAVLFPQLLGEAYRRLESFQRIDRPILVLTSEFGTVSMWDWEITAFLRAHGIETIAPHDLELTRLVCRALAVRKELVQSRFLVFQDDPGEGFQAPIFKRFYWWEDECTERVKEKFGLAIEKRSFRALGAEARALPDDALPSLKRQAGICGDLSERALDGALKLYLAIKKYVEADPTVQGAGINCLNESHFSDTTPCLAWSLLFEERKLTWGCEADTLAMLTQHLLFRTLGVPLMMTNLYPFSMGQAALKHEHIPSFPEVSDPENHILVAHCGYLGVVPRPFAEEWRLREKVLAIVDDNASAIDARMPAGDITLVKLHPLLDRWSVAEGTLEGYVQYPNSHCLNGGVIKVENGRRFMRELISHHYILAAGHIAERLRWVSRVFDLEVECI